MGAIQLAEMPGDREAKRAEAQKLKELIRTGEINPSKIDILSLDVWIEKNLYTGGRKD